MSETDPLTDLYFMEDDSDAKTYCVGQIIGAVGADGYILLRYDGTPSVPCSAPPKGSGLCLPCYTRWVADRRLQSSPSR
jgi:hypothetical protein